MQGVGAGPEAVRGSVGEGWEQAEALAWLCERLARVRHVVDGRGERAALERILAGLRDGCDMPALLEEAEELLRRCGVAGRMRRGGPPRLGLGGGRPVEEAYLCPRQEGSRCARIVLAVDVTGDIDPLCDLHGTPLRLNRY